MCSFVLFNSITGALILGALFSDYRLCSAISYTMKQKYIMYYVIWYPDANSTRGACVYINWFRG